MMMLRTLLLLGLLTTGLAAPKTAEAEELKIGIGGAFTSLDPHFFVATANIMVSRYIFDALVSTDELQRPIPGLATSWEAIDDTHWEFRLRDSVTFSNGDPFTAEDVAASLARAPDVEGSPSSFALYTRSIKEVVVKDPLTVVIETAYPNPTLPVELSYISIISSANADAATTDYNSLAAAVGTGPFIPQRYVPNEMIELTRNPDYWGEQPSWEKVTVRLIANNGARSAALLAGDVDVIDSVPPTDIERIRSGGFKIVSAASNRVIFIGLDQDRDESPFATSPGGKNPLKDLRVRKALSMAIDREAIAARIMAGQVMPAGQFLPDGFFGVSDRLGIPEYNPEAARELLAEAGLSEGISLTITGPSDRYLNASQVLQAVAQMFGRIGVETEVEMLPWNNYVARLGERQISAFFGGWGSVTGETGVSMLVTIGTFDPEKGAGGGNRGRYSNPELDDILEKAMRTMNDEERDAILAQASELAIDDVALLPLYFEITNWAVRPGIGMTGRSDQATLATDIRAE
ncbi:ABC transporter substrate-binding protein [Aquamicrobium sp. LC103]|uniref:ABC transporter substrate-binding protein n=1 Tax=Aquamicrobium sp. LC103 TaxID=1120658 RepID=UPI00069C8832|nr:ABC transporter substrate-binding protein [Aquamicrobium sp. LC103]TKT69897.1 ABC transporter substrate-binding protein [Aquamicrobium sp. LC103]